MVNRRSHTIRKWRKPKSQRVYRAECLDCGWAWLKKKGAEEAIRRHFDETWASVNRLCVCGAVLGSIECGQRAHLSGPEYAA